MGHPEGAGSKRADRVEFDRRVHVEFRGAQLSSDGGLLVMRELDDALGLSDLAAKALRDTRRGKNTVHRLDGLFRQSVFGRLAGYEDVNDADRLALDPVMRQVVGGRAVDAQAASASQMGRFETETLAQPENRAALADLNGQWIDRFHDRNGLKYIVLDMDSSVSPTHGDQEGAAWNGHFDCTCYHPNEFLVPCDCGRTGKAGLDLNMMSRSIEGSTQSEETLSTMENGMETLDANMLLFSVKGMTCGSCAAHIERAVREVPGVVDVSVDRPTNQVRIKTSSDTGQADIFVRAIALAGYVAKRVAP